MRSLLYSDKDSDRGSYNPFFIVRAFFLFIFASVSFVHDGIYYSWMEEISLQENSVCKPMDSKRRRLFLWKICIKKCWWKRLGAVVAGRNSWEVPATSLFFCISWHCTLKTSFSFPLLLFFLCLFSVPCSVNGQG